MRKVGPSQNVNFPENQKPENNKKETPSLFFDPHTAPEANLQKMDIKVLKTDPRMDRIRNLL